MAVTSPPAPPLAPPPGGSRERPEQPRLPDLGPLGTLRWLWRRLTSMRTALVLLLLLALATIPGSLLPQRSVDLGAVADFYQRNPDLAPWLQRIGLFNVYSSPWFGAVYLLLFVSLVGCIVPRTRAHVLEWFRPPPAAPSRLERLPGYDTHESEIPPEAAAAAISRALRRRRWSAAVRGDGREVAAQQGRLRETGNVIFHISMLGVLVALAGSALYSWRGEALVVEGYGFADTLPQYDSFTSGARFDTRELPPFALTLDGLQVKFESDQAVAFGAPRDFAATLSITDEPGAAPRSEIVRVNQPAAVDGARIYLSGNGYAPVVQVRDDAGELVWEGAVPFLPQDGAYTSTGVVKVPDGAPDGEDLALQGVFLPTAVLDATGPHSVFPDAGNPRLVLNVSTGDLGLDTGKPVSVFSLDGATLDPVTDGAGAPVSFVMAPGQTADLPDRLGSVTFVELRRFAAFDVRADPSGPMALVAATLVLLGLTMSLFIPYRRVWVRLTPVARPDGTVGTVIGVAGQSRPRDAGLVAALEKVAIDVREAVPPHAAAQEEP